METYVIYQDEEIKIEILKPFHQYLEETCPQWINLSYGAKDFLYGQVMKDLDIKKRGWDCQERLSAANCPIIEFMKPIALTEPFNAFNRALTIISNWIGRLNFNCEEIKEQVQESYADEDYEIVCNFFPIRLFNINGYLAYYYNGTLLILLFSIKEE